MSKYAILQEMNDRELECWYYFIKYDGNETNLKKLDKQLNMVEWTMFEDGSTFDLDLEHLVSETTAKEMTKLEVNSYQWHRKFDGELSEINFGFRKRDDNEDKINKVCDMIGVGGIEEYIDEEDVDEEDLTDTEQYPSDEEKKNDDEDINELIDETFR